MKNQILESEKDDISTDEKSSLSNLENVYFSPRPRAFFVGIPLLLGVCLLSIYADMVSKVVQFGVLQFAPPAIAALFAIAGINQLLKRYTSRIWLSSADLLTIYAMMLTGVLISTRGVTERLVPALAFLPYFATRENGLNEKLTQYFPDWAVPFLPSKSAAPPPEVIASYWDGLGPNQSIPWAVWMGPICAWFSLIGAVIWVFLCMSVLLRRQWMDNEQLRFPLTTLPLAVIRDEVEGQPFWSNKTMWMGFAFAFALFFIKGLHANFPDWPNPTTDLWMTAYFSERPWNQMDSMAIYISLAAIGFAYFLPAELLFSLWFFFLLTRLQDVAAVQLGGIPQSIGTHNARVWTGYQAAGAYLALVLAQTRISMPYFRAAWKTAFGKRDARPLDDSGEMFSYRTAILGLILGFVWIVTWLSIAGMNPVLAFAQMGLYLFVMAMIMSRGVAEAGMLMTETSFLPSHLIRLVTPLSTFGPSSLTLLGTTDLLFARDMRGLLLSTFLDNQKIAKELKVRPRSLLLPLASAIVIAMVASTAFFLWLNYTKGGLTLYGYAQTNSRNMFNASAADMAGSGYQPDGTAYGGLAVGVVVTLLLTYLRANFSWFPLHPLGYALAPSWAMLVLWFPFFVAWAIKTCVLRFGGVETYRKVAPFMLGMIGGEFLSAVFWAVMNMARGWSTPSFPWP